MILGFQVETPVRGAEAAAQPTCYQYLSVKDYKQNGLTRGLDRELE